MYPNFSEFGLYRYDNNRKQRNRNGGIFSSIIVYGILAMTIIFGALLYVFISSRMSENLDKATNSTVKHTDLYVTDTNVGLEVIEISSRNYTESHPKRIKRLDSEDESSDMSPESQKLTFYTNRKFKPPRIAQKPKVVHYPSLPSNHKISSRRMDPRIYQFGTIQPKPYEYLKPPTARSFHGNQINNIQDVINQNQHYPQHSYYSMPGAQSDVSEVKRSNPVQLVGTYRHPRTNKDLSQIFQQSKPQTLKAEASDPFQNFKPASPHEINQMLNQHLNDQNSKYMGLTTSDAPYFRRKFKKKISSASNYNNHASDGANFYGNGLQISKKRVQDRNEIQHQGKPFSVMLDVYPMPGDENEFGQQYIHVPNMRKIKPLLNRYYQDPQLFNTINYLQIMPRYPAYFRYQNNPKALLQQASTSYGAFNTNGMMKPSQLVVHLNLYPKNNSPTFKRSSSEDGNGAIRHNNHQDYNRQSKANKKNQTIDVSTTPFNINFNVHTGNGHPENIAFQKQFEFNRTSTEATIPQNYIYDDDDDDDEFTADQSVNAPPSVVYKDIYRDKPIQLMLRNTTTALKKPKVKKSNMKFHYQTVERPKAKYASVIKQKAFGPFY